MRLEMLTLRLDFMDNDFDTTNLVKELQWRGHVHDLDQLQDTTDSQSIER